MHYLIYQSRALISDTDEANSKILSASKRNNALRDVSGFLHREGDHFLQYLEGPRDTVHDLVNRIGKDPRHKDMSVIAEGQTAIRRFPDWQMGFVMPGALALADLVETDADGWSFLVEDPFDLVVFLSSNADLLRDSAA